MMYSAKYIVQAFNGFLFGGNNYEENIRRKTKRKHGACQDAL